MLQLACRLAKVETVNRFNQLLRLLLLRLWLISAIFVIVETPLVSFEGTYVFLLRVNRPLHRDLYQ